MEEINKAFRQACMNGNLELAKWLLKVNPNIDISAKNEHAFRWACMNGHLELAKWLLEINPYIDITSNSNEAFLGACFNGKLNVAQWLSKIMPECYEITEVTMNTNNKYIIKNKITLNYLLK